MVVLVADFNGILCRYLGFHSPVHLFKRTDPSCNRLTRKEKGCKKIVILYTAKDLKAGKTNWKKKRMQEDRDSVYCKRLKSWEN
ncbi:hypothetical protein SUGI_0331630 [Cryptomeria japonica]|nr:hypothetical protein SUGI_0331630 [Cryptomeria japonica]